MSLEPLFAEFDRVGNSDPHSIVRMLGWRLTSLNSEA
jgi:hypothetical protein